MVDIAVAGVAFEGEEAPIDAGVGGPPMQFPGALGVLGFEGPDRRDVTVGKQNGDVRYVRRRHGSPPARRCRRTVQGRSTPIRKTESEVMAIGVLGDAEWPDPTPIDPDPTANCVESHGRNSGTPDSSVASRSDPTVGADHMNAPARHSRSVGRSHHMRRKTFDALLATGGLVVAAILLVAGGLLAWAHTFIDGQVESQLSAQQIYFPEQGSESLEDPAVKPYIE